MLPSVVKDCIQIALPWPWSWPRQLQLGGLNCRAELCLMWVKDGDGDHLESWGGVMLVWASWPLPQDCGQKLIVMVSAWLVVGEGLLDAHRGY